MMTYYALEIDLPKMGESDLLIGLLSMNGFEGFEEKEHQLIAYIPKEALPTRNDLNQILAGYDFELTKIENRDWNKVWESNFHPIQIGDFCGIRATFHPPFSNLKYEVIINPKMSFGTGHHETTRLMIQLMENLDFKDKNVLDFGTGTGILSILSVKMGALNVVAIDNDENAVENARQNIDENGLSEIKVFLADSPQAVKGPFDFIFANITRNILLHNKDHLIAGLKAGGNLLLSGFLIEDGDLMKKSFRALGGNLMEEEQEGKWMGMRWRF